MYLIVVYKTTMSDQHSKQDANFNIDRPTLLKRGVSAFSLLKFKKESCGPEPHKLNKTDAFHSSTLLLERSGSYKGVEKEIKELLQLINIRKVYKCLPDDDKRVDLFMLHGYFGMYKKMLTHYLKKEILRKDEVQRFRNDNLERRIFEKFVHDQDGVYNKYVNSWTKKSTKSSDILNGVLESVKYLPTETIYLLHRIQYVSDNNGVDGNRMMIMFLFFKIVIPYIVKKCSESTPYAKRKNDKKMNNQLEKRKFRTKMIREIQSKVNQWVEGNTTSIDDQLKRISQEIQRVYKRSVSKPTLRNSSIGLDFNLVHGVVETLVELSDNDGLEVHLEESLVIDIKRKLVIIKSILPKKDFL
jgi:transcriptional regulator NrdR family protein